MLQTKFCSMRKGVLSNSASQPCMTHARTCLELLSSRSKLHRSTRIPSRPYLQKCQVFDQFKNWLTPSKGGTPSQPPPNQPEDIDAEDEEELFEYNDEGGTMVQIGADEENTGLGRSEAFGPLAVLLIGFMEQEVDTFKELMVSMDADMVKIVPCTPALLSGTLQAAVESEYPQWVAPSLGQRRVVVLSGMYGTEVVEMVSAYRDSGLPPAVFAAAVPNNYQRQVEELVSEVIYENNTMMSQRSQRSSGEDQT